LLGVSFTFFLSFPSLYSDSLAVGRADMCER
jgi:hypothetical protein